MSLRQLRLSGVGTICCLLAIFSVAVKPVTDPDFWWHLATGQYMASNHAIPHHDLFSLTAQSHAWITHEWVTELLFYAGWVVGGAGLLMLASAGVITLTFGIVYLAARERGAPAILSAVIVALAAFASAPTWGTRPQMLSLLLTALFGLGITRMVVREQAAPPWWMPAAMILWVNLHGGFIFGLAAMGLATAALILQEWVALFVARSRRPPLPSRSDPTDLSDRTPYPASTPANLVPSVDTVRCVAVVGLTALATLVNPNGLSGALYPLSYLGNNASTRYIAEWVSPDFHQAQYLLFEALVLVLLIAALASPRRARLVDAVIVLPFLYLAFESVRNIGLFAVLAAPIAAELVSWTLPALTTSKPTRPQVRGKTILNWLAILAIAAVSTSTWIGKLSDSSQAHAVAAMYPVGALHYIESHSVPARGFDSYNWGGFLIWNWYPNRFVFVDGRPDMYGDSFMDRYVQAYDGASSWRTLFATNRLCYALVEPNSGIAGVLRTAPGWSQVYHDNVSALFVLADHPYPCSR